MAAATAAALWLTAAQAAFAPGSSSAPESVIPADNLTANPSFKKSTKGWDGFRARLTRVRAADAPDGRHVAKVSERPGNDDYTIDDEPDTVEGATAGEQYTAAAWVKGSGATAGEQVELVIRESNPSGQVVTGSKETTTLTGTAFERVEVAHTVTRTGNGIDVYVARPEGTGVREDEFLVDAITLVAGSGSEPPTSPSSDGPPLPIGEGPVGPPPTEPPPTDPPPTDPPPVDPPPDPPPPDPPPPPPGTDPGSTIGQIATGWTTEPAILEEEGSRYRYIIVRDSLHDYVDEIRAANPGSKILLYKDVSFVIEDGGEYDPYQGSGISFMQANPHENWFLHNASGQRLRSDGYPYLLAANIANPDYQQAWYETVVERLRDANDDGSNVRYDGVFMDDTNLYPGHGMDGHIAEMGNDWTEYGPATESFVDYVGPRLKQEGFTVMPNLAVASWDATQRATTMRIAEDVSAINREALVRWSQGALFTHPVADSGAWMDELTLMEEIQAAGADYSAIVYGTPAEVEVQRYARATFLLGWDGTSASTLMYRTDEGDAHLPDWTTDVGTPTGARQQVGVGWRRAFTEGIVVVNPRASGSQSFSLGGSYRRPDGSCVSSVTLSGRRGLVMPEC